MNVEISLMNWPVVTIYMQANVLPCFAVDFKIADILIDWLTLLYLSLRVSPEHVNIAVFELGVISCCTNAWSC